MTNKVRLLVPPGAGIIAAARPALRRRTWGDEAGVACMLSAFVPGARSIEDCVRAGWPRWFASTCMALYDSDTGADDELAAATAWAERIEYAIAAPVDYRRARSLFRRSVLAAVDAIEPGREWTPDQRQAFDALRRTSAGAEIAGAITAAAAACGTAATQWLSGWKAARAAQREYLVEALEAAATET